MYAFRSAWQPAPGRTPPGATLLAVGDVHGCSAHLEAMLTLLGRLIAQAAADGRRSELVMIGDYVDRGPDSLGVLRALPGIGARLGVPVHLLLGNHDQLLDQSLRLMPQPEVMALWCENGGLTTLAECGIGLHELDGADPAGIAARLRARLGPRLIRTLRDLAPLWRSGSYLFVHGGIDPTRPPEAHSVADLVWMREPFLAGAGWRHPFAVVHGHTPCGPQLLSHRVAIDSGCFFSGVLTAVELADDRARFHGVTGTPDLSAFLDGIGPGRTLGFTTPERLGPKCELTDTHDWAQGQTRSRGGNLWRCHGAGD